MIMMHLCEKCRMKVYSPGCMEYRQIGHHRVLPMIGCHRPWLSAIA
jgi:hypothetical protein